MPYDFDGVVDRTGTNAMKLEGFRDYIFHDPDGTMSFPYADDEFIHMWVADMEFATPDVVIEGMRRRLDRHIFGYTRVYDPGYYEAFRGWCDRRYGWTFPKHELVMSNGVIPALYELVEYITEPDEKVLFLTPSYAYFKCRGAGCLRAGRAVGRGAVRLPRRQLCLCGRLPVRASAPCPVSGERGDLSRLGRPGRLLWPR